MTRGGIRFGPAVCGTDDRCTREDTATAHADGLHSDRLGRYEGSTWPVTAEEQARWAWLLQPKTGPHDCRVPNAKAAAFSAGLRGDDPLDEVWRCPDCLQAWEIEVDSCYECGRSDDPEWVRRREWAGQDTPFMDSLLSAMLTPLARHELRAETGYSDEAAGPPVDSGHTVTAAGGWCAPSSVVYDFTLSEDGTLTNNRTGESLPLEEEEE